MDAYSMFTEQPGQATGTPIFERIRVGGVQWGFQACSGATTDNVLTTGRYGDPLPQLALDRSRDKGNKRDLPVDQNTDLVTITIGGNNVEFSNVLGFCYRSNNCTTDKYKGKLLIDFITDGLNALGPQLDEVYAKIYAQAPNAKIVVAGYPQLFPSSPSEQNCSKLAQRDHFVQLGRQSGTVSIGFSQKEQNFLRSQTSRLNQVIADHVNRAKSAIFVRVDGVFASHEVCGSGGEWINGPTLTRRILETNSQSFHPNADGQRLGYAFAINGTLKRL